jgi:hypothetical protein
VRRLRRGQRVGLVDAEAGVERVDGRRETGEAGHGSRRHRCRSARAGWTGRPRGAGCAIGARPRPSGAGRCDMALARIARRSRASPGWSGPPAATSCRPRTRFLPSPRVTRGDESDDRAGADRVTRRGSRRTSSCGSRSAPRPAVSCPPLRRCGSATTVPAPCDPSAPRARRPASGQVTGVDRRVDGRALAVREGADGRPDRPRGEEGRHEEQTVAVGTLGRRRGRRRGIGAHPRRRPVTYRPVTDAVFGPFRRDVPVRGLRRRCRAMGCGLPGCRGRPP